MGGQKQIGWIAGPAGEIVKYEPPPPPVVGEDARERAYSRALARLAEFFEKECGFRCNSIVHGLTSISLGHGTVMFDVSIREPQRVAYVTSHPGYGYEQRPITITPNIRTPRGIMLGQVLYAPTATIKCLSAQIRTAEAIQIIFTDAGNSAAPVYVELPEDLRDPETYIIMNVLGVLKMMAANSRALAEVFETKLLRSQSPEQ